MEINSLPFAFFFALFFVVYYSTARKCWLQNTVLLGANAIFYGFIDARLLFSLCAVIVTGYCFCHIIWHARNNQDKKKARFVTGIGIVLALAYLGYFKYWNFFAAQFTAFCESIGWNIGYTETRLILPLGISFYTFKVVSSYIETYKGSIRINNIVEYANYISFFPTIASGPIDRPECFVPQLRNARVFDYTKAVGGTQQVLWGLFKKMVVADNLCGIVDFSMTHYQNEASGFTLFWVACLYSIQIYADFSGYADMSIGIGKLLGFDIMKNFAMPYFARNISEFWHKWHISLTSWFTSYVYIPLGGNRVGRFRHLTNIMIVFLVSGIWHGAGWTFVLWGAMHGVMMCTGVLYGTTKHKDTIAAERFLPSASDIVKMAVVFFLVTVAWIFFRAESINVAMDYISRMFSTSWFARPTLHFGVLAFPAIMIAMEWYGRKKEYPLMALGRVPRYIAYVLLAYMIIYHQGQSTDFIYFQF